MMVTVWKFYAKIQSSSSSSTLSVSVSKVSFAHSCPKHAHNSVQLSPVWRQWHFLATVHSISVQYKWVRLRTSSGASSLVYIKASGSHHYTFSSHYHLDPTPLKGLGMWLLYWCLFVQNHFLVVITLFRSPNSLLSIS